MVLYPLLTQIQRAKERLNRRSYEEMAPKYCRESKGFTSTGVVVMTVPYDHTDLFREFRKTEQHFVKA
jgi:hypothetical protein